MYDTEDLQHTFNVPGIPSSTSIVKLKAPSKSQIAAAHVLSEFKTEFYDMEMSFTAHEFSITKLDFFNRVLLPLQRSKLSEFPDEGTPEWTQLVSEINQTRVVINSASVEGKVVPPFELVAKGGHIIARDIIAFVSDKAAATISKVKSQLDTSGDNLEKGMSYVKANMELLPPESRAVILANTIVCDGVYATMDALVDQQIKMLVGHSQNSLEIFNDELRQLEKRGELPDHLLGFKNPDTPVLDSKDTGDSVD